MRKRFTPSAALFFALSAPRRSRLNRPPVTLQGWPLLIPGLGMCFARRRAD
jgi:hypothetical protein